ncbi:hypothetical protein Tco_1376903 [Tanacetum coccineum]
MLGGFQCQAFNLEDMSSGSSNIDISMREFKDCVEEIEMMDVHRSGLMFMWNQKPKGSDGVLKNIDRVMDNLEFNYVFAGSYRVFQPYRISDHAPCVLKIPLLTNTALRPFKFANFLVHNDRFKDVVKEGCLFFSVTPRYLNENVKSLRLKLDRVQKDLDADPTNVILCEEEAAHVQAFNNALLMQEPSVKSRISRSRINVITNVDGTIFMDDQVASAFVSYYEEFLSSQGQTTPFCSNNLFLRKLDMDIVADMVRLEIDLESDVINAVKEFFVNGTLLKELSHTIISLIPKVSSPMRINDYRPISCCNVLFKCISKIISNRIKGSLKVLVSSNQSAFVLGRRISDNILLTQELMHNYHLDRSTPRCAFKVDIQKAYDTVDWDLFEDLIFGAFGFFISHDWLDYGVVIMEALDEFKLASGLTPSIPKSTAYFCNVLNYIKISVPSIFMPVLRRKCKSKVAWEVVCLPKHEGGLGLRRLELFNKALMIAHIWSLLSHKESLWVKWIHTYKHVGPEVGNVSNVSAWFDKWGLVDVLMRYGFISDMHRRVDLKTELSRLCIDNVWRWPTDWSLKYPNIISLPVPMLQPNDRDCLEWRDDTGMVKPFSVAVVWECIRPRNIMVPWFNVVWFSEAFLRTSWVFLKWFGIKDQFEESNEVLCGLCLLLVVYFRSVDQIVLFLSEKTLRVCVLRIFDLYTSRLLDAACTSALNLLKKGLLGRKLRQLPKRDYRDRLQIADVDRMTFQNRRDLPRDIPLDSVVVLRYEKRSKSENKGKVPTEMELVLEQTQQGTSYEVSVDPHGFEDSHKDGYGASTPVVAEMHKEDLQATGGPTSLGVTSEARANPQLSSGMLAFNLNKPIYSTSFIIHSKSASKNNASAIFTAGADPGISTPSTDPHVLANKTKSISDGLETVLTTPETGTSNAAKTSEEIKFGAIKLEDLAKLVPNVKVDFKDLDSREDDSIIVVDDSEEDEEDKNAEIHSTTNDETEDISASTPPSPRSIQLQELKNQVLLLQSQKHTLETEKRKAEAEITRLKAQPFFPNVGQLNEHLVKSLTAELSKILSAHDFSSSLPTELKDLPSKFDELIEEVKGLKKQVHELEIELP